MSRPDESGRRSLIVVACSLFFALAVSDVDVSPAAEGAAKSTAVRKSADRLRIASWEDVQKRVATHKGKVVVVDVWTTSCPICLERFPEVLAIEKKFGADQVATITVNCDYDGIRTKPPEYYRPDVVKFLEEQQAGGEHVLLNESFVDFLERIKLGSTPAVFVFAADGNLAKRFDNDDAETEADEFQTKDVAALIERLLAEERK